MMVSRASVFNAIFLFMKIMISSLKNKYHLFSEQKLQRLLVCWTYLSCNTTKNDKYKKQHISLQFTFPFDTFNISAYPSVNYSFILKQCKLKSVILSNVLFFALPITIVWETQYKNFMFCVFRWANIRLRQSNYQSWYSFSVSCILI